jgi:hypothetical protein
LKRVPAVSIQDKWFGGGIHEKPPSSLLSSVSFVMKRHSIQQGNKNLITESEVHTHMSKYFFIIAEVVSVCVYATIVLMFNVLGLILGGTWKAFKWIGGRT